MTAPNPGGASLGTATGTITIDVSNPQQAVVVMRDVAGNIQQSFNGINTSAQQAGQGFQGVGNAAKQAKPAVDGLESTFRRLAGVMGVTLGIAGAVQLGRLSFSLAETAAKADQLAGRFAYLADISGESSEKMIAAMRKASRNHISDVDLMLAANRAMLLGVASTSEEMEQLLRIAGARAGAMGMSFTDAFDDLVTGIGRLSPQILDNLGIILTAEEAYEAYAKSINKPASALTAAEKRQAFLNAALEKSTEIINRHTAAGVSDAGALQQMDAAAKNARVALGRLFSGEVATGATHLTTALNLITDALERMKRGVDAVGGIIPVIQMLLNPSANALNLFKFMTGSISPAPVSASAGGGIAGADPVGLRFNEEQIAAWRDYQDRIADINRAAGEAAVNATRQYAEQRADAVRQYELTIAREAEDFGRQRLRQMQQLERQIERVRSDAVEQQGEWLLDLQERIGEVQSRGNERLAEIERQYQKNREKAERDHRDRLFSSAARLDAVAVLEEQRRFARDSREQEEGQREKLDKEQRNIQKQLDEAQKAHDKRLAQQRKADERRIQDLRENQALQRLIEDEDRAIRLIRMAEDHQAQLGAMARAHAARMEQISDQQGKQLEREREGWERSLAALGIYHAERVRLEEEANAAALRSLGRYVDAIKQVEVAIGPLPSGATRAPSVMLPSLRDPDSLNRGRLLPSAQPTGSRSLSVQMQAGAIQVYAAPGQSAIDIGQIVDAKLLAFFKELAQ